MCTYMGGVTFPRLAMGSTRAGSGKHTVKKKMMPSVISVLKYVLFLILNGDISISEYISGIVSYLT